MALVLSLCCPFIVTTQRLSTKTLGCYLPPPSHHPASPEFWYMNYLGLGEVTQLKWLRGTCLASSWPGQLLLVPFWRSIIPQRWQHSRLESLWVGGHREGVGVRNGNVSKKFMLLSLLMTWQLDLLWEQTQDLCQKATWTRSKGFKRDTAGAIRSQWPSSFCYGAVTLLCLSLHALFYITLTR